jgi:glucokinase
MSELYLGIDLGGTSVKLGVCGASGESRGRLSIPTEPARGPEDVVGRIGQAAARLMAQTGRAAACGSGVPGPLDLERRLLIRANNLPGWSRVPYPELLARALGGMPTVMENDANCAAWGELVAGAGRGVASMALYTLGTGVGGGIILDGKLWVGASGAAGEFGHMTIDPAGPLCGCGQRGCVEQYASASALAARWGKGDARACFEAARAGDPAALAAVDWAADGLAQGLANAFRVLHPELIVLAGGVALAGDFLLERVRQGVRRRLQPSHLPHLRIEASQVPGDDAGWLGAALWGARRLHESSIREPTRLRSAEEVPQSSGGGSP